MKIRNILESHLSEERPDPADYMDNDDLDKQYMAWVENHISDNYVDVFRIAEDDLDEDQLDDLQRQAQVDLEDVFVERSYVSDFRQHFQSNPLGAIERFAQTKKEIAADDELRDAYEDEQAERSDPYGYRGVSRRDFY